MQHLRGRRACPSTRRRCIGSISLKGGLIDDLTLKNYHETIDKRARTSCCSRRLKRRWPTSPSSAGRAPSPQDVPDGDTVWTAASQGPLTPANPVTLTWDNGRGLVFTRNIAIDDNYLITVTDSVENKTGGRRHAHALRPALSHRHAARRRLRHPARRPDRRSRRKADRDQVRRRPEGTAAKPSPTARAAGSASPTSTGRPPSSRPGQPSTTPA